MANTLKDYRIRLELQTKGAETAAKSFAATLTKIFTDAKATAKSYNDVVRKEAIDTSTKEIEQVMKVNKVRSESRKEQAKGAKEAGGKETEAVKQAYSDVEAASKRLTKILIDQASASGDRRVEITKERINAEENLEVAKFKKFKALSDQRLAAVKGDAAKELKIREDLAAKELALERKRASATSQRAKVDKKPSSRGVFEMPGGGNITHQMAEASENFTTIAQGIQQRSLATVGGLVGGVTGGMYGLMADQAIQALKLVGGAALDAAKMARQTNGEFEVLSKTLNMDYNSNEFQNIRLEIIALDRPLGVSVEKMAQLAGQVSSFAPPDKIVETVDQIRALGEVAGGAEQMQASQEAVNKLTTQMGASVPVADLLATSLTELRGKGVDLGTAQTAIGAAFEKGKKAFADNETAATQATAVYTELAKSGLKTKEVATVTSGSFEELSKAVSDPKMIATITESLPEGMDATTIGLEKGQLDIVKFISSLQKMGPEGAKIAKVVGQDTEKAFGAFGNRMTATGQTLDQMAGKFTNAGGNAQKFADLFESEAEGIAEKQAMLAEEIELTFGTKLEGALKGGQGMFLELFDVMKSGDFQNILRDFSGSLGPLGGIFESVVDMFVDSGVEAKRAVGEFNTAVEVANGFQAMVTGLNELPAPAFLDEVKNNLVNLQKVAPGAAEEIKRLTESANAADPANIEKIKVALQQISDVKAGEVFGKMLDATKALDEQLTDLTENAGSFWGALVKGVVEFIQYLMPLSFLFEEIFGVDFGDMVKEGFDAAKGSITEQVNQAKSSVAELQKAYDDAAKSGDQGARLKAAKELEEARTKQFDLMKQESQLEDTATKNIQTKLEMREKEAQLSGVAFDKQAALNELLDSTKATLGVNAEVYDRIAAKSEELVKTTEETASATGEVVAKTEELVDLTEEELKLAVKNSEELDKYLEGMKGIGATMEEQAEMEKADLRAKIEKNKIIEVALESQLAAIDAAIVAQNNSVDAENQRIKAAQILAEKQEEIQKIISGQQAEATAVELVQAGNLNAAREKIASQLDSIRKANAGLEKAIGDVDKRVADEKKKKTDDAAKKEADAQKKAADAAEKRENERMAFEKEQMKQRIDMEKDAFDARMDELEQQEKAEADRAKRAEDMMKALQDLTKSIDATVESIANKSEERVRKIIEPYLTMQERFSNALSEATKEMGEDQQKLIDIQVKAQEAYNKAADSLKKVEAARDKDLQKELDRVGALMDAAKDARTEAFKRRDTHGASMAEAEAQERERQFKELGAKVKEYEARLKAAEAAAVDTKKILDEAVTGTGEALKKLSKPQQEAFEADLISAYKAEFADLQKQIETALALENPEKFSKELGTLGKSLLLLNNAFLKATGGNVSTKFTRVIDDIMAKSKELKKIAIDDKEVLENVKEFEAAIKATGLTTEGVLGDAMRMIQEEANKGKSATDILTESYNKQNNAIQLSIDLLNEKAKTTAGLTDAEKEQQANLLKAQQQLPAIQKQSVKELKLAGVNEKLQEVLQVTQTLATLAEDMPGKIKGMADSIDEMAFQKGAAGGVTEAVIQGAEITEQVGQALMSMPSQTMKMAGGILLIGAKIAKAIAKVTQFFLKDKKTQLETAEENAAAEEKITRAMETRLNLSKQLTDMGNVHLDQAREQFAVLEAELDLREQQSAYAKQFLGLTDEQIAKQVELLDLQRQGVESDLERAENLLESGSRADIGDFLRAQGIDTKGSNKKALREYIDSLKAAQLELNSQYEAGNITLEQTAELRQLELQIIEEEIDLLRFRMKLDGESLELINEIRIMRKRSLVEALNEAGVMVTMSDTAAQIREAMSRFAADENSVISPEIIRLATAWEESNREMMDYKKGMEEVGAAIDDLAEKHKTAFDNERRLLELRTSARVLLTRTAGETDDALAKRTDEEFEVRLLALLRRRVAELENERDAMEDAGASADKLLENEFARLEVETEIWNMLHKQNGELDKEDAVLNEMIRSRQKLLEMSRPGGLSAAEKAAIAAKTAEMVAHLTSIGKTPEEIQKFLDSLPQFEEGGPTGKGGTAMTHPGEYIVRAAAVDKYGVNFFDQLNKMQIRAPETGENAAGQILNRGIMETQGAMRILANNISITLTMNNTISSQDPKGVVRELNGLTDDSLASAMNRAYESGKFTTRLR